MNYATLKKIYESLPYVFKAPFSRILRNKLIENKLFIEYFNILQDADRWSNEKKSKVQFNYLKDTLIHAFEHTKYYKELFDSLHFDPYNITSFEDIKKIPVLTKKDLQERLSDLIADDAGNSYLVTTGGTSGEPTKVMMSNDAYYIEWAFVYNFWSKYGYDIKSSKLATFRGVKLGKKLYEINPMYREIRFNVFLMGRNNIYKYIKAMRNYGVDFIFGYPSAIYNFCKLTQEAGIQTKGIFKAALLISENLYPFQEEMIKGVLKCPIGMFYGHSERAVFAGKYENGYLFNPLYGVTEFNEKKQPIVTGFINRKTPLIRYLVDDYVTRKGDAFSIEGHHDFEVLLGGNGEEISTAAINFHDKTFDNIREYQFIQNEIGKCTLCVVPSEHFQNSDVKKIESAVSGKFGRSIECKIEIVDKVQLTNRGKFKMIIKAPKLLEEIRKSNFIQ